MDSQPIRRAPAFEYPAKVHALRRAIIEDSPKLKQNHRGVIPRNTDSVTDGDLVSAGVGVSRTVSGAAGVKWNEPPQIESSFRRLHARLYDSEACTCPCDR